MPNPSGWQAPEGEAIKYLSDDELRQFFSAIDRVENEFRRLRDRAMFQLILAFGLRCAEVPLIKVTDFNGAISPGQLRVTRVKLKPYPKSHPKAGQKKPRESRWYDLSKVNEKAVRAWLKVREQHRYAKENPALFLTFHSDEEHAFSTAHIYDLVRDYAKAAKLERHIWPHMFRHTTAVKMAQAGMSAYDIMHRLGHTSVLSGQTYVNRFGPEKAALDRKSDAALEF